MIEEERRSKTIPTQTERECLRKHNLKWCSKCQFIYPRNEFNKTGSYCRECRKEFNRDYYKKYPEKMREFGRQNHYRNYKTTSQLSNDAAEERRNKERRYRSANREHFRQYKRNYEANRRASDPTYRVYCRLLAVVRRFNMIGKNGRSLWYIGVSSAKEFVSLMNEKCANQNWLDDGYHIDHVWQIGWFNISEENWKDLCPIVNRHQNLRPLSPSDNMTRTHDDYSPLQKEDFEFYRPYLKESIAKEIEEHFQSKV